MNQKQAKAGEMFFVVDEYDRPLKPLPRRLVHGHGIWHRVAHIWVVNDKGQVLCQQRSKDKELHPGWWEARFGGHMRPNETYQTAAARELEEELGITPPADNFKLWKIYEMADKSGYNNEFQGTFTLHWNGSVHDVHFKDAEVEEVVWKSIAEVKAAHDSEEKWVRSGYEREYLDELEATMKGAKA